MPFARKLHASAAAGLLLGCCAACGAREGLLDEWGGVETPGGPSGTGGAGGSSSSSGSGGACSSHLQTDPNHCGRCNHPCLGGACLDGRCMPFILASGQDTPLDIAVDATHVYWTNNTPSGAVMRIEKEGGVPVAVATGQAYPFCLAMDDTRVYWTNNTGALMAASKTGGDGAALAWPPGGGMPYAIAADGGAIWWTTSAPGALYATRKMSGTTKTFFQDSSAIHAVELDATHVFFMSTSDGVLRRMSKDGGPSEALTSLPATFGWMAIDDAAVYGSPGTAVAAVPKQGAPAPVTIAHDQAPIFALATDETRVFWTVAAAGGAIAAAPKDGSAELERLADNQSAPGFVAVDGEAIYWTNRGDGTVMKLAK